MKKTILSLLLCVILSVGLLTGAALCLDHRKNEVAMEERIISGDRSAADGLRIELPLELSGEDFRRPFLSYASGLLGYRNWRDGNIWWDISQRFEDGEMHFTPVFQFTNDPVDASFPWPYSGLILQTLGDFHQHSDIQWRSDTLYQDLQENITTYLAEGERSGTAQIDLSDYYETLPLWFDLYIPDGVTDLIVREQAVDSTGNVHGKKVGSGYALYEKLQELFPIPIADETYITIEFSADLNNLTLQNARPASIYGFDDYGNRRDILLQSVSAYDDDGIYFALSPMPTPLPEQGAVSSELPKIPSQRFDLSGFPMGYGIYYLPLQPYDGYESSNMLVEPNVNDMINAIPLDVEEFDTLHQLFWDQAADRLYLLSSKEEQYSLRCYKESSRTLISTIHFELPPSNIRYEDDYLLISYNHPESNHASFSVYTESENGYSELFSHTSPPLERYILERPETQTDFDGRRLAIASPDEYNQNRDYHVLVYDKDGLQFQAEYTTSLHDVCFENWNFYNGAPMKIGWDTIPEGSPAQTNGNATAITYY